MFRSAFSRRLPALLAAYVIAFQALLLPVAVVAAAPLGGAECQTANASGGEDGGGCPCAAACGMLCCAQALAAPPQPGFTLLVQAFTSFRAPAAEHAAVIPDERRPQVARAPPAV